MDVANIFKFIGISFIPVITSVGIYVGFKYLYRYIDKKDLSKLPYVIKTKERRYWFRQIVSGLLLGVFSIGCYYLGVKVNDYLSGSTTFTVGISTFFPVVAGFVFGWPSCVAATLVSFIFRACIPSFLRWATVTSCLIGGLVCALASHFIMHDKRAKWYYAFFGGVFVETINILLLYIFYLNYLSKAYATIVQFDVICVACNGACAALSCLIIQLLEKEKIATSIRKNNRIASRIQISLFAISFVALVFTSGVTYTVAFNDAYDSRRDQLYNNVFDMHNDFKTMKKDYSPFFCADRHLVSEKGFVLTVCAQDVIIMNDEPAAIPTPTFYLNQLVGVPDLAKDKFGIEHNMEFKFDDGTNINKYPISKTDDEYGKCNFVLFDQRFKGEDYLVSYSLELYKSQTGEKQHNPDKYYSIVFIPYSEIRTSAGISFRVVLALDLIAFVALFALVNLLVSKRIISNIEEMDNTLERIMDGEVNEEIKLKSGYKEFEQLSNNINLTIGALRNYGEEIERRMADELEFAKKIQENSLPTAFPNEEAYNIYALMNTAKEVGGDFYDCVKMNNGKIMFLIADVSGKGIPAAMFMMRARTLIKSLTLTDASVAEIATQTNNLLIENNESGIFVTAWIGILNPATGEVNYVNAGHCEPLIKCNGKYEVLHTHHQLVLAAMKDTKYTSDTLYLKPGEELLLYTDGVTEATNKDFKQYGLDRLVSFVNNTRYFNAKQLLTEISDEVAKYEGYTDQFDDITMLSLRYIGVNINRPENVLTLKAYPRNASVAINYVESILTREGLEIDPKCVPQMSIVVDELFANVSYHAYPHGAVGDLTIEVDIKDDILYLTFIDTGIPFDPTQPFNADVTSGVEERKQGGLGIFLVKRSVDKLTYERKKNQNILYLEKNLKPKSDESKKEDK